MTCELKQAPAEGKLWTMGQISMAATLGGFIAGSYFLGRNFKQLGKGHKAKYCYLMGIASTVLILTFFALLPDELTDRIPTWTLSIIFCFCITVIAEYTQKGMIAERLSQGSKRFSHFWCFLVIWSLLVLQVPLILIYSFFMGILWGAMS